MTFPRDSGAELLEEIGMVTDEQGAAHYRIVEGDPLSARAWTEWRIAMSRGDWRIRTESRTEMTSTADRFIISAQLDAYEGETRIFSRTWDRAIPRDMV